MSAPPKTLIVLKTEGRPQLLARVLASIVAQTDTSWSLVVYLQDKGTASEVQSMLDHWPELQRTKIVDSTLKLRHVVECSSALYMTCIDDQTIWDSSFLEIMVSKLSISWSSVAVCCSVETIEEHLYKDQFVGQYSTGISSPGPGQVLRIKDVGDLVTPYLKSMLIRQRTLYESGPDLLDSWGSTSRSFLMSVLRIGDIKTVPEVLVKVHRLNSGSGPKSSRDGAFVEDQVFNMELRDLFDSQPGSSALVQILQMNQERLLYEFGHLHKRLDDQIKVNNDLTQRLERIENPSPSRWWKWRSKARA